MFETIINDIKDENGEVIDTYEMLTYTDENGILWSVPTDPMNYHYQAYLASLESE